MVARRLVLVAAAITATATIALWSFGGTPPPVASRYVSPAVAKTPDALGARVFETKGCAQCHSIDGSPRVGPSFKGSFGTQLALTDGVVVMDEAYIRESLMTPHVKARPGYQRVMPSFAGLLQDREVDALIAYLRTLR